MNYWQETVFQYPETICPFARITSITCRCAAGSRQQGVIFAGSREACGAAT